MKIETQIKFGKIECLLGIVSFLMMSGFLFARDYYSLIWPHKSAGLEQMAMYPAVAAFCFFSGGVFLIYRLEYRFAFQPILLLFGFAGIGVPIGVFLDVYT